MKQAVSIAPAGFESRMPLQIVRMHFTGAGIESFLTFRIGPLNSNTICLALLFTIYLHTASQIITRWKGSHLKIFPGLALLLCPLLPFFKLSKK